MSNQTVSFITKKVPTIPTRQGTLSFPNLSISQNALRIWILVLFIVCGIAAPIAGQILARLLNAIGVSTYITIWLVPGASLLVVLMFWKIFKKLGLKV